MRKKLLEEKSLLKFVCLGNITTLHPDIFDSNGKSNQNIEMCNIINTNRWKLHFAKNA